MNNEDTLTRAQWHRDQAIDNFNAAWDLMGKTDRTPEDDLNLIHTAHASRFHWGQIGTPLEFSRGEWQLSRVYAVLGKHENATYHANHCLKLILDNGIGDFDLAFAYEALARAAMVAGDVETMEKNLKLALEASEQIADKEDKEYTLSEIRNIRL